MGGLIVSEKDNTQQDFYLYSAPKLDSDVLMYGLYVGRETDQSIKISSSITPASKHLSTEASPVSSSSSCVVEVL